MNFLVFIKSSKMAQRDFINAFMIIIRFRGNVWKKTRKKKL